MFNNRNINRLAVCIIIFGVVLRAVFYLQNRCLFIDEANVARNIYERGFTGLAAPLNYEQYAPPLFLWIVKCCTLLFGYSEPAYRLFPFLCGLGSLWLMYVAVKKYASGSSTWYALAIISTGVIYVRYGAELKQYGCDMAVTLALLLLALSADVFTMAKWKFLGLWFIAGSVAIWLSMPSVFMLAGVGIYYLYQCIKARRYANVLLPAALGVLWMAQFVLYYFIILKPQIQSDYLQNCHKDFFLYALPNSSEKLGQDINVLNKIISAMGGKWTLSVVFHLLALGIGLVWLLRKETAKALLAVIPICLLLFAAMARQYALTPRLILFVMPLLLIIIAAGLGAMFQVKSVAVKAIWVAVGLICIANFGAFSLLYKPMENEELTKSMAFAQQQNIDGDHLYVHNLATPAYIYYTTIHPAKNNWKNLANAHLLQWNTNYDSLSQVVTGRSALLYSWAPDDEIASETMKIQQRHKEVAKQVVTGSRVYIYE